MIRKILLIVGTRPNLVKITQFKKEVQNFPNLEIRIAHTGQHHTKKMSSIFLEQFNIEIDYFLGLSELSPNSLIGEIIIKLELVINTYKPDLILCVGDVNSTLATAICANKMNVKLGHIESGLRSNDKTMPEEINRILTDEISDICFVTEQSGLDNLVDYKPNKAIEFVGNTMIDTLISFQNQIDKSSILEEIDVKKQHYFLLTMHRPSNVDDKKSLQKIIELLNQLADIHKVVFPIHPRTENSFKKFELYNEMVSIKNVKLIPPQGYFAFQKLIKYSFCVITDSGGIQEETTFQQIPCITLRENTERPVTITEGTNTLKSFDNQQIINVIDDIKTGKYKKGTIPKFWDGNATYRILQKCNQLLS